MLLTDLTQSGHVDAYVDDPVRFDAEFDRVVDWAADNRAAIHQALERAFGPLNLEMDLPHNTYERQDDGSVIIRKGSVKLLPDELSILPSHMTGDVVLVRAKDSVGEILNSISHGTGRTMSRGDCKVLADKFDFAAMRQKLMLPTGLQDASLRTDVPETYRDLDKCLELIRDYIEPVTRFAVIGYMGHLY